MRKSEPPTGLGSATSHGLMSRSWRRRSVMKRRQGWRPSASNSSLCLRNQLRRLLRRSCARKTKSGGLKYAEPMFRPNYGVGAEAGAGAGAPLAAAPLLTMSFNSLLGLKKGIFLAGTSTRSPVFGLRPTRGLRWRVRKLPKPRISILSPARSERTMLSKMVSTMTSLSRRVTSARRETSSIRSAFVISYTFHLRYGALVKCKTEENYEFFARPTGCSLNARDSRNLCWTALAWPYRGETQRHH